MSLKDLKGTLQSVGLIKMQLLTPNNISCSFAGGIKIHREIQ